MRSAPDRDGDSSAFEVPGQGRQKRLPVASSCKFRNGSARAGKIRLGLHFTKPSINHAENIAKAHGFRVSKTKPCSKRTLKRFRQNGVATFQTRHPTNANLPQRIMGKKLSHLVSGTSFPG